MRIVATHSHLGGLEHLLVRKKRLWKEIDRAIRDCDPGSGAASRGKGARRLASERFRRGLHRTLSSIHTRKTPRLGATGGLDPGAIIKDRVIVSFGRKVGSPCDLFAKPLAHYVGDLIDVGIEILPMKELQARMSSGVAYYEGELYNLIREGRGVPAVPLVLVGVAP